MFPTYLKALGADFDGDTVTVQGVFSKKDQAKAAKAETKRVAEAEKAHKSQKELDIAIGEIVDFFTNNKTNLEIIKPILAKCKEMGYSNPKEISNLEDAKIILAMTLK